MWAEEDRPGIKDTYLHCNTFIGGAQRSRKMIFQNFSCIKGKIRIIMEMNEMAQMRDACDIAEFKYHNTHIPSSLIKAAVIKSMVSTKFLAKNILVKDGKEESEKNYIRDWNATVNG